MGTQDDSGRSVEQRSVRESTSRFVTRFLATMAVFTLLDWRGAFMYLPYWVFVAAPLVIGLVRIITSRSWVLRLVVCLGIVWLVMLPWIRWTKVKSFYLDCTSIAEGMDSGAVRELMAEYMLAAEVAGNPRSKPPFNSPHLTFHPSRDHSADWCVVTIEGRHVARVSLFLD